MVSLLDVGLLKHFQIIFPFLFITVFIFAMLTKMKLFGDNKGIHMIIALLLGFMSLLSPVIRNTINIMAPWFVLLIIMTVFIIFAVMTLGGSQEDI